MEVGSKVNTPYGVGIVSALRSEDGFVIVEPLNWLMANNKPPTFFLQSNVVTIYVEASDDDFTNKILKERLAKALDLKNEGAALFKMKNFDEAKLKYLQALQCIQGLGDKITNEHRAMVFELTIPCSINASLCLLKGKKYSEAVLYADNSVRLIDALESRLDGQVWVTLQNRGMTWDTLLKNKRKGLFMLSKAQFAQDDLETSRTNLKSALALIPEGEASSAEAKELSDLLAQVTTKIAKETSKQKAIWSKAFKKNSEEVPPPPLPSTLAAIVPNFFVKATSTSDQSSPKRKSKGSTEKNSYDVSLSKSWFSGRTLFTFGVFGAVSLVAAFTIMRSRKS